MAHTLEEVVQLTGKEIARLFAEGSPPDPDGLVDWEFRGYNLPWLTKVLGFQKFKKGFYKQGDTVWGYNIPVEQGPLSAPWRCRPSDDTPKRFGFYRVEIVREGDTRARVAPALLLDYGQGKNGLFEGSFLRDYVRQLDEAGDLLMGRAYVSLAGAQTFPSIFVIQRDRRAPTPVQHRA